MWSSVLQRAPAFHYLFLLPLSQLFASALLSFTFGFHFLLLGDYISPLLLSSYARSQLSVMINIHFHLQHMPLCVCPLAHTKSNTCTAVHTSKRTHAHSTLMNNSFSSDLGDFICLDRERNKREKMCVCAKLIAVICCCVFYFSCLFHVCMERGCWGNCSLSIEGYLSLFNMLEN